MARTPKGTTPDYEAFAKDLMALCGKHGVCIQAANMGNVMIGRARVHAIGDHDFWDISVDATHCTLGDEEDTALNPGTPLIKVTAK
jgi:hypothetical protein